MFPTILIVDDEPSILKSLKGILTDEGFEVITASNGYEALKLIEAESPDLVILDVWMPGIDGIETLKEIKKENSNIQVIIITGHGTIDTAVKATKSGAYDFIEKPLSIDKVIVTINNALNFRRLEEENRYLRKKTIEKHSLTGNSPSVKSLQKQIAVSAPTDASILIIGENGTGKELVARTIHQFSMRNDKPLIDINCAVITDELIESELFGHEKGTLAGSSTKKIGKFELANNGTVFLDEIGDMSLKTQAKILKVLEEQKFQRMGGGRDIHVNIRIIAATNKNLENEINLGNFREDLYYRLNVVPVKVPPLRERLEDIPILVQTFLKEFSNDNKSKPKQVSPKVLEIFSQYSWPGNVREMKNLLGRLSITVDKDIIEIDDIPAPYNTILSGQSESIRSFFSESSLKKAALKFEIAFIIHKLAQNSYNYQKTAKEIGVDEAYVRDIIKKE